MLHRFLLAHLYMQSLRSKPNPKTVRHALATLPDRLGDIYEDAMRRIEDQDDGDRKTAELVLTSVCCAIRPLTLTELQLGFAMKHSQSTLDETNIIHGEVLVSLCAGLVTIDDQSKTIRLVHYTVQEYIERILQSRYPNCQKKFTEVCLAYLSQNIFTGHAPNDAALELHLEQNPFFQYAAQYWGDHAAKSPEETVTKSIVRFLRQDSKVPSSVQVMLLPQHRWNGYSQKSPTHVPAISVAACLGLAHTVRILLENGADINAKDSNGSLVLHWAAMNSSSAPIQILLLQENVDINARNNNKETALHCAAMNGHLEVIGELCKKGIDVMARDRDGWTALDWAAIEGHDNTLSMLLAYCKDPSQEDNNGRTALHHAAEEGYDTTVQILLDHGANVHAKDRAGRTALMVTAKRGHTVITQLLLKHGADVNCANVFKKTSLHYAITSEEDTVVHLLLRSGADPSPKVLVSEDTTTLGRRDR